MAFYLRFVCIFFVILILPFSSAAHFIVGHVASSLDGRIGDGFTVVLWNSANGINDNVTDIIGETGNSATSQYYLIDCEALTIPCQLGDNLTVQVIDINTWSINATVAVSGEGYDVAPELRIDAMPFFYNLSVDDNQVVPIGEIDLVAAGSREVFCSGIVSDLDDGDGNLSQAEGLFYSASSSISSNDENRTHYTNSSCFLDSSFGESNESLVICRFLVAYYAAEGVWNCTLQVEDFLGTAGRGNTSAFINPLLALGVSQEIDFGVLTSTFVSSEITLPIANYGNTLINLSLNGYAAEVGDNYSMNCSGGINISINYLKYNLTSSTPGFLDLFTFEQNYKNLTSNSAIRMFNLFPHGSDPSPVSENTTYWRIYVPLGIQGNCSGNVVVGAVHAPES